MRVTIIKFGFLSMLFFLVTGMPAIAQDVDLDKKFKKYNKLENSRMPKIRKKLSFDLQFSSFFTEAFLVSNRQIIYKNNSTEAIDTINENTLVATLFSATFAPRYNLYQDEKIAYGLKGSIGVGLSAFDQGTLGQKLYSRAGFFHLQYAAGVFYAQGLCGPYNNIENTGFQIGLNLQGMFAPLIKIDESGNASALELQPGSKKPVQTNFFLPALNFDFYNRVGTSNRVFSYSGTVGYWINRYYYRIGLGYAF